MNTLKGLDISEYQGVLDFGLLKQNFDFIIARAGFGTARCDAQFIANRDGLRSTGQLHGFYWYAYPNNNLPEAEAEYCFNTLTPLQDGEIVALDFEEQFSNPPDWCLRFLQRFQQLSGYKPLLYANLNLLQNHDWSKVVANDNGLWLACWDYNPDGVCPNTPWSTVAMRQYTNKFAYSGKTIDGDVFYGDAATFQLYGYKKSNAPVVGAYYKGLDLTNQASMKVAVDMWDAVVNQGQYVPFAKYNADIQTLKDAVVQKNTDLDSTNQTLQTIKDKYLTDESVITDDKTKIGELATQLETLQKQLEAAQSSAPQITNVNFGTPISQVPTGKLSKIIRSLADYIYKNFGI